MPKRTHLPHPTQTLHGGTFQRNRSHARTRALSPGIRYTPIGSCAHPVHPTLPAALLPPREPLYANAHRSCWWELTALAQHAHPSVAAMARALLAGSPVLFDGDPLRDLSLGAFLEKFVNKKPKVGAGEGPGVWVMHANGMWGRGAVSGEERV